jgi:DNA mismatch repair protein MutS2
MEGLKALYQTRSNDLKKNRKKYEKEAIDQSKVILEKVNRTVEKVIREIRESQARSDVIKRGKDTLRTLTEQINQKIERPIRSEISIDSLELGQSIKSRRFSVTGQITKIIKEKKQVEIDVKGVKLTLPLTDILFEKDISNGIDSEIQYSDSSPEIMNEIDLRGKITEDALVELEQYLDHALNSDWHELRIIHGKGTGALRKNIQAYLKKNKNVKSFRPGNYGEGDTGVTIIEL